MRRYRFYLIVAAAGALAAVQTARAVTPDSPQQAITDRENGMKGMGHFFFPLGKQLPGATSVTQYADGAKNVATFATQIPTLFPPGSETGQKTRAKPEVWAQPALFKQDAENLATEAGKLAQLAAANDKPGFVAQYKVVNNTCDTCHDKFRTPEN